MKLIHPHALFRLSVLGPLASRDRLEQGDLKAQGMAGGTLSQGAAQRT